MPHWLRIRRPLVCAGRSSVSGAGACGLLSADQVARSTGQAGGVTARRRSDASKMDHTWARVKRLGLHLVANVPDSEWISAPEPAAARRVCELRAAVERKVREAVDPERLGTALTFVERFVVETAGRPLFRNPLDGPSAVAHNAQTFELLRESIVQRGSIRPGQIGKRLAPDTVSDYISAFATAVGAAAHVELRPPDSDHRRARVQKLERKEAPRAQLDRSMRRLGFRVRLFKQVPHTSFDRTSVRGDFRWTTYLATWACLMRPGEPGFGRGVKPFDCQRGICVSHVLFWPPELNTNSHGLWAVCLSIVPSKDQKGTAQRRPTVVSALEVGAEPSDNPTCVYSHVLRLWRRRVSEACQQRVHCCGPPYCRACSSAPLFAWPGTGVPWSTADGLEVVRDMATALGLNPNDYAGHSGRIAGASDIKDVMGPVRGAAVVHQRGRWDGDMEVIYARETSAEQMEASQLMGSADRPEMEALLPGWVQPTRNWAARR